MPQEPQAGGAGSGGAAAQVQEKAQQAKDVAQDKAQEAAGQAKGRLQEQVDQRSTQLGEQVTGNVQDLRSVGEQLRQQGKDKPAQVVDQVAERGERLGGYLKESDADRILSDVEDFGRQRPWAVVAGGLALGLAASRFLKASSSRRYGQRQTSEAGYEDVAHQQAIPAYTAGAQGAYAPGTYQPPPGAYPPGSYPPEPGAYPPQANPPAPGAATPAPPPGTAPPSGYPGS